MMNDDLQEGSPTYPRKLNDPIIHNVDRILLAFFLSCQN